MGGRAGACAGGVKDSARGPVARSRAAGFDPVLALARFDAYPLLAAGVAITTGPTSNNFRDLRLPA